MVFTPCSDDIRRRMHLHTNKWTTQKISNKEEKALSVCIPLLPVLPFSVCPPWSSHPISGLQGRTGSTNKHVSFPVGSFWGTSWKADGSPVLSGQPPDGKHTDIQKAVHALSFSRLEELPVDLSLSQTICKLCPVSILYTYFTPFMCFPPFKTISEANSVQQSGFAPKVQGSSGWFLQFITSFDPTEKPNTSIPLQYMN